MSQKELHKKMVSGGKLKYIGMYLGVVCIAANLRAPLTAVGSVVSEIGLDLDLSNLWTGMITTIPLIAFALLSSWVPRWSRKWGMEYTLFYSLLVLMVGLFIRQWGSVSTLFLGAALVGMAITVGNVLMPAYIKNKFTDQVGIMTGIYSVAMNLTAALAAGFSISLGNWTGLGWKGSIGIWILLAGFTALIWIPQLRKNKKLEGREQLPKESSKTILYKSTLAWAVTLFMGLQSLLFYCIVAWLPKIMQTWGMPAEQSGWILSYVQFAQLPMTFLGAVIASKMKNQLPLAWAVGLLFLVGIGGVLVFHTEYIVLWCICIGTASGLAFSLSMLFFVLRTRDAVQAAELSGMAQAFGYLIAACGPPLFGALYDGFQSWMPSFILLLVLTVLLLIAGLKAGKDEWIE